jgi:nitroreductase
VDVDDAIRERRTLKAFTGEVVDGDVVRELLALAVHAPNHHRTEPWRFVVLGPETIGRLAADTGDAKLLRSRTAVVVGQLVDADPATAEEDYAACACAIYAFMLAARARGLASYWRTPGALRHAAAAAILGLGEGVRPVGIVHLGQAADPWPARPPRAAEPFTAWLP